MKCSLKVSGKDNHTGSQQTMIDEQYMMVWAGSGGGRSISTRRNGSLTVRWKKLAGIKKCQIENAYISDSWQPHSLSQIGHKFMIFYNCSCFDTLIFQSWKWMRGEYAWGISPTPPPQKKKEFRVPPCEKLTLNAKRVNSGASHPPLNFATLLKNLWPTGGCASKLLWRVTPSKALRAGLMNIYTLIRCPDLSGCDRKEWWVLRSWGTQRDKGVALLMQILHST